MFIFTAKLDKKKAVAIILILAVVLIGIILIAGAVSRSSHGGEKTVFSTNLKTNEDRVAFLTQLGWQVEPEPVETQDITIPRDFSGVYEDYVKLQNEQGFTLEKYGGMKATRYTYKILNYPSGDPNIVADMIIYGTQLIAGDIQCTALDGFMIALLPGSMQE